MERNLPEVDTEYSVAGQRLHHAAATLDFRGLDEPEIELVQEKLEQRDRFLESLGLPLKSEAYHTEHTLPYVLPGGAEILNHADFVGTFPAKGAVVDYKFGFEEVDPPDQNHQLMVYIGALAQKTVCDEYYGLIIPRFGRPAPPVIYRRDLMPAVWTLINMTYAKAMAPGARRIPSFDACRYCKGLQLGVCPEARSLALSTTEASKLIASPEVELTKMSPETRTKLFDAFKLAETLKAQFSKAAKVLLEKDPEFIPGYRLSKEGEVRTKVTDLIALRDRLNDLMIMTDDFLKICSISNKALSAAVRSATGLKGRALEARIEQLTKGLVDSTPVERSLERV
ncbi:MAG TPA: hypothetical protein VFU31_21170 [Candidatus Binatia bacterium]|nr:hypothetical protein [Candidatus Binatia bacterium]